MLALADARALAPRLRVQHYDDSPLGSCTTTLLFPGPELRDRVLRFWDIEGTTLYDRERILPTGAVEVIFNLGVPALLHDRAETGQAQEFVNSWVSGIQQEYLVVGQRGVNRLVAASLKPLGVRAVLGLPASEIALRVVDLAAVVGWEATLLRERLLAARSAGERLALVESFVARRLLAARLPDAALRHAVARLEASAGGLRIGDLAAEVGLSQKTLIERFRRDVGLTPKRFARLARFRRAVERLQRGERPDWACLAQESGFYDQAHFVHEFRRFTGSPPEEFLRHVGPDGGSVIEAG